MTSTVTPVTIGGRLWTPGEPVYVDPETGQGITTHSMMKVMRRCPKQFEYKYIQRLKPKMYGRPLRFGTWMHALMEANYKGEDVEAVHKKFTMEFSKYFDEEKAELGDLPRDVWRTWLSYLWHYKNDPWIVHEVEFTLEVELPDGNVYRCRLDMLIENQYGLWIVDHKNHKTLPRLDFRMLDAQSALYIWAALKNKIPVQGHIWNYLVSKPPHQPELVQSGARFSKTGLASTDYPTLVRAIKKHGFDPADYTDLLRRLRAQQYQPGVIQTSSHFRRDVLEKTPVLLKRVANEAFTTHIRQNEYRWDKVNSIERVPNRDCAWMCSYNSLCTLELFGGDTRSLRKQQFTLADPMDYYYDEPQEGLNGGD